MPALNDNSLRQAAVFVRSLDADAAATMLARLSAGEAKALRSAIRELGEVNPEERQGVADVLSEARPEPTEPAPADGVELQLSAEVESPPESAPVAEPQPAPSMDRDWLSSIEDADPQAIADYLAGEQPSAVAVVIGSLPASLSAAVLQCFSTDEQEKLLARLAEQDEADPDSVRVIGVGLAAWIDERREAKQRRTSRLSAIREILDASPTSTRDRLLDRLADSVPELAPPASATVASTPTPPSVARLRQPQTPTPRIAFDDLHQVDSRTLAEGVAQLDPRSALLALAAAPTELVDRLVEGLSRAAGRDLRARLRRVGPTTLTEIDRAQTALALAVSGVADQTAPNGPSTLIGEA